MDLAEKLLVLAGAAAADGGRELLRAIRSILAEIAPFDAGEAVLRVQGGTARWRLDDREGELLGEDLLRHVVALRAPLRLDELDDLFSYPETRRRMEASGMRSLLVLPLPAEAGEGAVAVSRRYGWAFVGTSLHLLWPMARMAGISLQQSVLLTDLSGRVEELEDDMLQARATPNELRARLERSQDEVREREEQRAAANAGWEATRAELRQTARALAAAEETARAAGAAQERAEARGAERERQVAEEVTRREAAEADAQRRQAEADEKLGRAEGERQALAVELEVLRREREGARGREHGAEQERSSLRAALAEQEARATGLESRVAELERLLAERTRARDEAAREASQAKAETESSRAQAASLRDELAGSRREVEALRARLAEMSLLTEPPRVKPPRGSPPTSGAKRRRSGR